ncbi:Phosphoglycerate/bisphosphoglycerate mutase [Stappia aggregata IAM 12614]|uniref:Phosphoglycerate/bisphosphoglycerate mutase n=1 Tax=Roseibium aggregatum (strain ATCC 25650 / DSM 13394 / JCM 20685 / NBRC 16684 / NCIMB 2208 / IAM 12614 / B1) TaxID=384765 RepID=A0P431_ROSAI|nr:histidine phosphatase family protein [Roseibium aggregatum]EAV40205.1 Phosphoglycerate/bisphosphoglycerate mutase [Stappia aggregata IAM 12614] [Roseibium aggregatum IAM 12614]
MTGRFAILVRHGAYHQKPDTPSALQPYALTDAGKVQAQEAGSEIADIARQEGFRLAPEILCSRQLRAWQTAALLGQSLGERLGSDFTITEDEALAERSVGALANLTLREIEQVIADDPRTAPLPRDWKSNSHHRLPVQGAESLMDAGERVAAFLEQKMADLNDRAGPNARIFVGHGASIRHAAHCLGVLSFDQIRQLSMHHARALVLKLDGNGTWTHHGGDWKQRRPLETATD